MKKQGCTYSSVGLELGLAERVSLPRAHAAVSSGIKVRAPGLGTRAFFFTKKLGFLLEGHTQVKRTSSVSKGKEVRAEAGGLSLVPAPQKTIVVPHTHPPEPGTLGPEPGGSATCCLYFELKTRLGYRRTPVPMSQEPGTPAQSPACPQTTLPTWPR